MQYKTEDAIACVKIALDRAREEKAEAWNESVKKHKKRVDKWRDKNLPKLIVSAEKLLSDLEALKDRDGAVMTRPADEDFTVFDRWSNSLWFSYERNGVTADDDLELRDKDDYDPSPRMLQLLGVLERTESDRISDSALEKLRFAGEWGYAVQFMREV